MTLPFWKVQSIGNDFPLIHIEDLVNAFGPASEDPSPTFTPELQNSNTSPCPGQIDFELSRLAAVICDRRLAVGGDGLLAVSKEDGAIRLRMFNPDGSEDFCGNGLRCAADHVFRQGWVGASFTIRHFNQEVPVRIEGDHVFTTLPPATYDPDRIPMNAPELFNATVWSGMDGGTPLSLSGSVLSTGTAHTIIPTYALPDDDSFRSVSAKIEVDERFPLRTSIMWSKELAENVLQLRIWERAVGETQGCGSGSSAAAVDYLRRKGRGGVVEVRNPGGSVIVRMNRWDDPIEVEGIATQVYTGVFASN